MSERKYEVVVAKAPNPNAYPKLKVSHAEE
jgi:hypothetical protein